MKDLKKFNINIYNLKNGQHEYLFNIDDSFFSFFENSILNKGRATVSVTMDKTETFISCHFNIEGVYELTCDRSLENFMQPFTTNNEVIFKYGAEYKELDDEIVIIEKSTQTINVAQLIYEYISITVPMKKIHPNYADELADVEEGKIIFSSEIDENADIKEEQEDQEVDPRWLKLKDLKNLNK